MISINDENYEKIKNRFQRNLSSIRKLLFWSMDDLAKKIDLSKQTIYKLEKMDVDENGKLKYPMSYMQFITLSNVIYAEITETGKYSENNYDIYIRLIYHKLLIDELDNEERKKFEASIAKYSDIVYAVKKIDSTKAESILKVSVSDEIKKELDKIEKERKKKKVCMIYEGKVTDLYARIRRLNMRCYMSVYDKSIIHHIEELKKELCDIKYTMKEFEKKHIFFIPEIISSASPWSYRVMLSLIESIERRLSRFIFPIRNNLIYSLLDNLIDCINLQFKNNSIMDKSKKEIIHQAKFIRATLNYIDSLINKGCIDGTLNITEIMNAIEKKYDLKILNQYGELMDELKSSSPLLENDDENECDFDNENSIDDLIEDFEGDVDDIFKEMYGTEFDEKINKDYNYRKERAKYNVLYDFYNELPILI